MEKKRKHSKTQFFAPVSKSVDREIDMINNTNIYFITLIVGIVQTVSITIFFITHFNAMGDKENYIPFINVSISVVLCVAGFIISSVIRRDPELFERRRIAVKTFFVIFILLLVIWGMAASFYTAVRGLQILTFYTIELLIVLLVKLRPWLTAVIILGSYTVFYFVLEFNIIPGQLNVYNYFMLAGLSVAGGIINYRLTVRYIEQKNKADALNEALEIIANHDSMTRLKNRYALNQITPEYINKDICLAIGDINGFKKINDTYGHHTGDKVLKQFADILRKYFSDDEVFRYGGDEFLIVTPGNDFGGFSEKLRQINEDFGRIDIRGMDISPKCSFGCESAHPNSLEEFFDVIMRADKKLYEIKTGGAKAAPAAVSGEYREEESR